MAGCPEVHQAQPAALLRTICVLFLADSDNNSDLLLLVRRDVIYTGRENFSHTEGVPQLVFPHPNHLVLKPAPLNPNLRGQD
jgi:hypothetical protein